MLTFVQRKPHPSLQKLVRGYWLLEGDDTEEIMDYSVPDGYPELFFVLAGQMRMPNPAGHKIWSPRDEAGLIGQITSQFSFATGPFTRVFFVKLYPWSPHMLFGNPAWQTNNLSIELGALCADQGFRGLKEQLANAGNFGNMCALLDTFLLHKLALARGDDAFLQHAVRQIFRHNGTLSVDSLTQNVRASRRHVEKIFRKKIGLPPKQYAQIVRVKKAAMCLLDPRFRGNVGDIAAMLDYYDPSHFSKDFKSVMEIFPTAYMRKHIYFSNDDLLAFLDQLDYS